MAFHELKCVQPWFDAMVAGTKTAELRLNDRSFKVGDTVRLREYTDGHYTDRDVWFTIGSIVSSLDGPWLAPGYVMLSLVSLRAEVP